MPKRDGAIPSERRCDRRTFGNRCLGIRFDTGPDQSVADVLAEMDLLERVDEPDGYRRVELVVEEFGSVDGLRAASDC